MCTAMDFVRFVGQDGWHWLGTLFMVGAVFNGVAQVVRAARGNCASPED